MVTNNFGSYLLMLCGKKIVITPLNTEQEVTCKTLVVELQWKPLFSHPISPDCIFGTSGQAKASDFSRAWTVGCYISASGGSLVLIAIITQKKVPEESCWLAKEGTIRIATTDKGYIDNNTIYAEFKQLLPTLGVSNKAPALQCMCGLLTRFQRSY